MAKPAEEHASPSEKAIEEALSRAREHLRTLSCGGRWGDVTIRVEAGRPTFVDRFEREKIS